VSGYSIGATALTGLLVGIGFGIVVWLVNF
jgi:hypothetical protein